MFLYTFLVGFLICCFFYLLFRLLNKIHLWIFFAEKQLRWRDICFFCRDATLQPPGVNLRTFTWLAIQFNPRDTASCEIRSTFWLRAGLPFGKCSKPVTRYQNPFKFVVLVRCKLHLVSCWWSSKTSFWILVDIVTCPIWPLKIT